MAARTPEECDELFARHVNGGDLDALVALYEPRGSLMQSDGTWLLAIDDPWARG